VIKEIREEYEKVVVVSCARVVVVIAKSWRATVRKCDVVLACDDILVRTNSTTWLSFR
jgi:hypothetical protein